MKGKSVLITVACVAMLASGQAFAAYESIEHNLLDNVGDTFFDAGTGALTVSAVNSNLTLNDPGPLGGVVTNGAVSLNTTMVPGSYDPITHKATFTGGDFAMTFDYNSSPYEISGPIGAMVMQIDGAPGLSYMYGQGFWTAATKTLPGSNDWPDGGGFSSITSLSLAIGIDLSLYEWNQNMGGPLVGDGGIETLYQLWPDDRAVPEPAALILLGLGGLLAVRRRRA